MKLAVLLRQCLNPNDAPFLEGNRILVPESQWTTNPRDELALETILRIKDEDPSTVIALLAFGAEGKDSTIRQGLALGADSGYVLEGVSQEMAADSQIGCGILAQWARDHSPDYIFLGEAHPDWEEEVLPALLAGLLGCSFYCGVKSLRSEAGGLVDNDSGLLLASPAVVSLVRGPHELRRPDLKGLMAARKKKVNTQAALAGRGTPWQTVAVLPGSPRNPPEVWEWESEDSAVRLIRRLIDEAKVWEE